MIGSRYKDKDKEGMLIFSRRRMGREKRWWMGGWLVRGWRGRGVVVVGEGELGMGMGMGMGMGESGVEGLLGLLWGI